MQKDISKKTLIDAADAAAFQQIGKAFKRKTDKVIYGVQLTADVVVNTSPDPDGDEKKKVEVKAGDWVMTDGERVWPVDPKYLKDNYEEIPRPET